VTAPREDLLPRSVADAAACADVPSRWRRLSPSVPGASAGPRPSRSLRILVCAGEACTRRIVKDWSVSRRFYNAYGPTEVTIAATCAQLANASAIPTIGTALPDKTVYLLDEALDPNRA